MTQQAESKPMRRGEYLKQLRLKRRLTLEDVAVTIKLDQALLADIEADRELSVAPLYREGYIKSYARFLEVPEQDINDMLGEVENSEPGVRNVFPILARRNSTDRWLKATTYVLASLLIGTLAWQFTYEAVRLSQNGVQLQAASHDTTQNQGQEFDNEVQASIAPLGVLHDDNPDTVDVAEQAWQAITRPPVPEGESGLQISVSADSWVEITDASGQEIEMDLLRGGSERQYHGKPPFRILLGRASAVRLAIDGEPVDVVSHSRDDVAQFSWPTELRADGQ